MGDTVSKVGGAVGAAVNSGMALAKAATSGDLNAAAKEAGGLFTNTFNAAKGIGEAVTGRRLGALTADDGDNSG